jgi:hypothetical protein
LRNSPCPILFSQADFKKEWHYDSATGKFTNLKKPNREFGWARPSGLRLCFKGQPLAAARLAWFYSYGRDYGSGFQFANGNSQDLSLFNLVPWVLHVKGKCQWHGISRVSKSNTFQANYRGPDGVVYIGKYKNEIDAARAWDWAICRAIRRGEIPAERIFSLNFLERHQDFLAELREAEFHIERCPSAILRCA